MPLQLHSCRARAVVGARSQLCVRAEKNWAKESGTAILSKDMLKAERYVVMNRFKVKYNAGARFEKRWATRKSRLATLDGFRFFCLLRRVPRTAGEEIPKDEPNYVSFTIWQNQENFQAWYSGEAFKEAHGGGSLFGFVDMLINATFTLNGAPKPAFWDGLLPLSTQGQMGDKCVENGWRVVDADGRNTLDSEMFVVMNRFQITKGREVDFEQRWAKRESKLKQMPGFKAFILLRRDGKKADDGFNYSSVTIWQDRLSFQNWTKSQEFAAAHAKAGEGKKTKSGELTGVPSPAFYEGVLALETSEGA